MMPKNKKNLKMSVPSCENFSSCYIELCKQQRSRPLPIICLTLPYTLDFTTDRVKIDDWGPILNSLSFDKSLKIIKIKSKYQYRKSLDEINSELKTRSLCKSPIILSRYLLEWLTHSIAQCVRNSISLTRLEIEGIPLPPDCLAALCVGIAGTVTLKHLSLQRCYIGDNSCALICKTIIDVQSIKSLNLSQCGLTSDCGPVLAAALSRQQLLQSHDKWKDSLRYRIPNLDAMPGLRRLTLNGNPNLGDQAVVEVIEAIQDSLWIKAIDLQHCGITNAIANEILDLSEINTTLEVFDVRLNIGLSPEVVDEVGRRIEANHNGTKLQYRFLNIQQKNTRAVSAGVKRRDKPDDVNKFRPKSAVFINSKKLCQVNPVPVVKILPLPSILKKTKVKSSIPPCQQRKKVEALSGKENPKVGLHLDLQQKIQRVIEENPSNLSLERKKVEDNLTLREDNNEEIQECNVLAEELEKVRVEQEKLDGKIEKMEFELQEERNRRMKAESRLSIMNKDLEELECVLKEKEYETRGCLLISQQSLDEISDLFEKLIEMLDDLSRNPETRWYDNSSDNDETESIKRKVALILRKTKSESLNKKLNIPNVKFTKSTGDIKGNELPLIIEKDDVGDAANTKCQLLNESYRSNKSDYSIFSRISDNDYLSSLRNERNFIGDAENKMSQSLAESFRSQNINFSPRERARELFSQFVNSEVILKFGSHNN